MNQQINRNLSGDHVFVSIAAQLRQQLKNYFPGKHKQTSLLSCLCCLTAEPSLWERELIWVERAHYSCKFSYTYMSRQLCVWISDAVVPSLVFLFASASVRHCRQIWGIAPHDLLGPAAVLKRAADQKSREAPCQQTQAPGEFSGWDSAFLPQFPSGVLLTMVLDRTHTIDSGLYINKRSTVLNKRVWLRLLTIFNHLMYIY